MKSNSSYSSEQHFQNKITLLTFFCSFLVIWIHTFNLETYGITDSMLGIARIVYWIETFWSKVTAIAVPMFFLISGFLFYRTFSMENLWEKYKTRLRSIIIPYISWATLYYFYFVIISLIPFTRNVIGEEAMVSFSIMEWIKALWVESYYTLWFLKSLIIFIVIAPLLYIMLKNRGKLPIGTMALVIIMLNSIYCWVNVPSGLEIYAIGSWLGINYKELVLYRNRKITFVAIIYICWMLFTGFKYYNIFTEVILFSAMWFALDVREYNAKLPWWMKITFFTYVAHDVFLEAFEKIVLILFGNKAMWALLDYVFMPIIVFILLVVIAYVMKKYFRNVWKVLTGYR